MIPRRILLGAGLALPAIAKAQTATLAVSYCNPVVFREPMERIAALFESRTGTKVTLRAPEEDYEAQLQRTQGNLFVVHGEPSSTHVVLQV